MYSPKIKALHDEYCELIDFCREHNANVKSKCEKNIKKFIPLR